MKKDKLNRPVVYLVFQWRWLKKAPEGYGNWSLEFQGVFSIKEEAVAQCKDKHYWVAPAVLNQKINHKTGKSWHGAYFPIK